MLAQTDLLLGDIQLLQIVNHFLLQTVPVYLHGKIQVGKLLFHLLADIGNPLLFERLNLREQIFYQLHPHPEILGQDLPFLLSAGIGQRQGLIQSIENRILESLRRHFFLVFHHHARQSENNGRFGQVARPFLHQQIRGQGMEIFPVTLHLRRIYMIGCRLCRIGKLLHGQNALHLAPLHHRCNPGPEKRLQFPELGGQFQVQIQGLGVDTPDFHLKHPAIHLTLALSVACHRLYHDTVFYRLIILEFDPEIVFGIIFLLFLQGILFHRLFQTRSLSKR